MGRQQILQRPVWLCLHGGRLHHLDAGQALAPRSAQARRGPRRAGRRAHFPAAPPHLLGRHPLPPARQGWEPRQHPRTRAPARAGVPRAHRLLVLRPAHHGQRAAVPGALARARGPREALAVRGVHQGRRGRVLRPRRRGELVRTHAEAPREHPERARGRPRAIEDSEDADSMTRMISRRINRGRAGDACDRCGGEGEEGGLLRCSGCKVTRHCGAACQRAAWGKHKATCREWS
ncbi:hypothetical protein DFJ74DRAFT_691220 [Hyaloraphidium curvatum]|nr:hypothetical protein DFJ74DRAFT_691220 [Hyaloraphidium curvatum]